MDGFLKPGQICIIDKDNETNIAGQTFLFVKIIRELPRLLRRSFEVQFCTDKGEQMAPDTFVVNADKLWPYFATEYIIRYPTNTPMINKVEVDIVKRMFTIADRYSDIPDDVKKAMEDLVTKLEFFVNVEREY